MANIPTDIWLNIAQFIPDDHLSNLINVNSFFYELGMDIRYRRVSISSRKSMLPASKKILERISDPTIGQRVRDLYIELAHKKTKHGKGARSLAKQFTKSLTTALHRAVHVDGQSNEPESSSGHTTTNLKSISFTSIIKLLIDTLPRLKNVTELFLDFWDLPATYDLQSFFLVVWSSFGRSLRSLSISVDFQGYRNLIASNPPTDSIREVNFEFANKLPHNLDIGKDTEILLNDIAPFLNNGLGPRLESLRISSWDTVTTNFSPFLAKLGPFPRLKNLSIRAPFKRTIPVDVFSTIRNVAPTLQKLQLRLYPIIIVDSGAEESLGQGLHFCRSDVRALPNLRVLDIHYTSLNMGIDVLAAVIRESAEHLSTMLFRLYYLGPRHTKLLVSALSFCKNLSCLHFWVMRIDASLFDLLAKNLPNLRTLSLLQSQLFTKEDHSEFQNSMRGRWYPDWKLRSIEIWEGTTRTWRYRDTVIFSKCIPSVDVHIRSL